MSAAKQFETGRARILGTVPRLVVGDVVKTAEYYRDRLGFQIDHYERKPPVRAALSRDAVQLRLDLATTGAAPSNREFRDDAVDVEFLVDDVDGLADELRGRKAYLHRDPQDVAGGRRELRVVDCNGFVLAFVQPPEETS